MHPSIREYELSIPRTKVPNIEIGDSIRVEFKITEGDKTRLQAYEGVVIKHAGSGLGETITVRKISFQVGVERVFPLSSPLLESITVVSQAKVRRSKLYYLRDLKGRSARLKPRARA